MNRAAIESRLIDLFPDRRRPQAKEAMCRLFNYIDGSRPPEPVPIEPRIKDAQIDAIAEAMPGGFDGFLKTWGYRQFARQVLELRTMPTWEPQFDCMTPEQERLAMAFCQEIAGLKGASCSPPDPVRLLEMAEALYKAERADAPLLQPGSPA